MAGALKIKVKKETLLQAIKGSGGIVSRVAERLGVAWNTARILINEEPEAVKLLEAEGEIVLDIAELSLFQMIRNPQTTDEEGKPRKSVSGYDVKQYSDIVQLQATKFYLATKGKKRGYVERQELSGPEGGPITGCVVLPGMAATSAEWELMPEGTNGSLPAKIAQ